MGRVLEGGRRGPGSDGIGGSREGREVSSGFRSRFFLWVMLAILWVVFAIPAPGNAQEMEAPMGLQITTFIKIMDFDREFFDRVGDEVVVGVLYQSRLRVSAAAVSSAEEFLETEEIETVRGLPLRIVYVDLSSGGGIETISRNRELDLLYVAPIRAFEINRITEVSREMGLPTMTGVREFVEDGLGLGVTVQGQRLRILVNLPACMAEGMDLSSDLLKLAEVLR